MFSAHVPKPLSSIDVCKILNRKFQGNRREKKTMIKIKLTYTEENEKEKVNEIKEKLKPKKYKAVLMPSKEIKYRVYMEF